VIVALFVIIIMQKVLVSAGGLYRHGKQKTKHKWGTEAVKKKRHPKPSDNAQTLPNTAQHRKMRRKESHARGPADPLHALLCDLLLLFDASSGGAGLRVSVVGKTANESSKRVSVMQ
jgi:hypothetical protein